MKDILTKIDDLIHLTESGGLAWEYMEDAPCLTSSFEGRNYIICKEETDNGKHVVSLNYLNKSGELIGTFNKWEQGDTAYDSVNKLYELAERQPVLKAC